MKEELLKEIAELKNLLLFYHGESIRKIQINEIINNIETKINELWSK